MVDVSGLKIGDHASVMCYSGLSSKKETGSEGSKSALHTGIGASGEMGTESVETAKGAV